MQLIQMSDYNRAARIYWWATTLLGALTVIYAGSELLLLDRAGLLEVAAMMAVVCLAGLLPIRIPGTQAVITPVDIFVFFTAIYFGAAASTLVAAIDAFVVSCRKSQRWTSRLGGPAMIAISVFASANLFHWTLGGPTRVEPLSSLKLLTSLLLFSLAYFLLNTLLLASSYALKRSKPLLPHWWANYGWTVTTYAASAAAAGVIYLAINNYGLTSLLAAGPFVAIISATCYFYFKQAEERANATERIGKLHLATVEALATAIDAKDAITHDHVHRVQIYACGLARHFGLSDAEIEALKAGALLHDVGKIAVPDYILNKPGKLTAAEFDKMKIHTIVGAQILERVGFPYPVVPIVRHHHERWDGRGYPDGLKGEHIPMTARILTVVDCFDAVREDRQYRKGMTRDEACQLLREGAGKQYDPGVVDAFLENLPMYEAEIAAHKESQQPLLSPSTQAGLSEGARNAVPAAGLAQPASESHDYVQQISAAHTEVATLYEMAQSFSASLNVQDAVTLAIDHIKRTIPFTTCAFYLHEEDGRAVAAHVFGKNADRIRGRALAPGRGIVGWVITNGKPMSNTDPMLDLNDFLQENDADYRTAAVYPLSEGDKTTGAIALYASEIDSYSNSQLNMLEAMARFTSTALQNARLYEKASAEADALTGLPGARAVYAQVESAMVKAKEEGGPLQLLSLSITGMRTVNYAHGYQTGDRVLAKAAGRLRQTVGEAGLLGRLAGCEFICILEGSSCEEAARLGERIRAEIGSFAFETAPGQYVRVGLRFGVAEYSKDGQTPDELLHAAAVATRPVEIARRDTDAIANPSELHLVPSPVAANG